jgi:hypothetical protein
MFSYIDVKTELGKSVWTKQQKDRLGTLLPQLGPFSLRFLMKRLHELGSEFSADRIIRAMSMGVEWHEALKQGQTREFIATLNDAKHNPLIGYGWYVVPTILDIRSNPAMSAKITPELSEAMVKVESRYFKDLPEQQVVAGLQYRLIDLIEFCSIVSEVKRYCYYRSDETVDTDITKKFQYALEQNQESVGSKQITINKKTVDPTVRNWLSDFVASSNAQGGIRSSYNLIQYLTLNPNMKLLSEHEQATVAEIFKLYNWLLQPVIIESEIEHYEQELAERAERGVDAAPSVEERLAKAENMPNVPGLSSDAEKQRLNEKILAERAGSSSAVLSARPGNLPLARGISLDQSTNIKLPQEAERLQKQRDSESVNIARKLEDLRKRSGE